MAPAFVLMSLDIRENVQLAPFTTFGIGGPARYFVVAKTRDDICSAFEFASARGLKVFVLGGGSNLLVSDAGFDGLVINIGLKGIDHSLDGEITAMAGEDWDTFVDQTVGLGMAGLECLSGIPGLVGGTPVQNVGAYGQEVSETITKVECFDRRNSTFETLSNDECSFVYRRSIFNSTEKDRFVVLSVTYRLQPGGTPKIEYRDLAERFRGSSASLRTVRDTVIEIRRSKSMVIDAKDPNSKSAGSFFKNPIISVDKLEELRRTRGDVPFFAAGEALAKVPAAWLIERAGFAKGYRKGRAGISTNHSLALVNYSGAGSADIVMLMDEIRERVASAFGIDLNPEPVFVGFD